MTREVEVAVPGTWFARPIHDPNAPWVAVTETPAFVPVQDGEAYRLSVHYTATDEHLCGLAALADVPGLQILELANCSWLTDVGLTPVSQLVQLRVLDLQWNQGLTDAAMAHLQGLRNLEDLNLTWVTELTDAGLRSLTGLRKLRRLELDCCWNLTGEGLRAFQEVVPACELVGP